jgi:hypothetical protein
LPTPKEILLDFVLPAILTGVALLVGWFPRRNGRWIGAIAFSAGFALADCQIAGTPHWPPGTGDAAFWIVWFIVPIAFLGLLDALLRPPYWLRAMLLFVLVRLGTAILIAPVIPKSGADANGTNWSMGIWLDSFAAATAIFWLGLETLAERTPGTLLPILLTLTFAGAAAVLGLSDNVRPSQECAALAGLAMAAAILARPLRLAFDRGAVLAAIVPMMGMFAFAHFYSYNEPPVASIALLLLAPLLAWCGETKWVKESGPTIQWIMRIIPVLLCLAAAIFVTAHQFQSSASSADKQGMQQYDE